MSERRKKETSGFIRVSVAHEVIGVSHQTWHEILTARRASGESLPPQRQIPGTTIRGYLQEDLLAWMRVEFPVIEGALCERARWNLGQDKKTFELTTIPRRREAEADLVQDKETRWLEAFRKMPSDTQDRQLYFMEMIADNQHKIDRCPAKKEPLLGEE